VDSVAQHKPPSQKTESDQNTETTNKVGADLVPATEIDLPLRKKELFHCPVDSCPYVFSKKHSLTRHTYEIHRNITFHCSHCPYKTLSHLDFKSHSKSSHSDEKPFRC